MTSPTSPSDLYSSRQRWLFLAILFLIATSNFVDRNIVSVLLEPIKKEFAVSDTLLGLLSGASFAVLYSVVGIPVSRWADRGDRKLIITLALTVWSLMTALCGAVQNFWQLALVRVGVGVGEAGAIPSGQSLLVDYFPPLQRSRALAIFMSSAMAGYLLAFVLGAQIAATWGWRWTFVLLGLPGLLIAVLSWFVLDEPRQVLGQPAGSATNESFMGSLRVLWRKPSYRSQLLGLTLYIFIASAIGTFTPSFLMRVLGIDLKLVGVAYGGVNALATLVGTIGGGILADRLAALDTRWLMRLPALGLLLAFPFFAASFLVRDFTAFLVVSGLGFLFLTSAMTAVFTAAHAVCGAARRAMSIAILFFFMSLVGASLGPLTTGILSDLLQPRFGVESLAHALVLMTLIMPVVAWLLFRGGQTLEADTEA